MTIVKTGYTVGSNAPLTHARILWDMRYGGVSGDGDGGDLAQNDFTNQKWFARELPAEWIVDFGEAMAVDTVFLAAHNLGLEGVSVEVFTSDNDVDYVSRGVATPIDDSAIAFMFNNAGADLSPRYVKIVLTGSSDNAKIGIIRMGKALQMQRSVFGGVAPLGLNRVVSTQQAISEGGAWLSRRVQRVSYQTAMNWQHLSADWYRANFEPFARTLPAKPFAFIQNEARMPESVAWCWTDESPAPSNMGIRDLMEVSLNITGFGG